MTNERTESCGRCAMSTVVDAVGGDEGDRASRDPFADGAIELDEETLRRTSPSAWMSRVTSRLDAAVRRFIYG